MPIMRFVPTVLFAAALMVPLPSLVAFVGELDAAPHAAHVDTDETSSPLVEIVRRATDQFRDVRRAGPDYMPALGCVSGPVDGAMGVHFINGALLMDGALDANHPEALIYEMKDNVARLVGVEFIVLASVWHETHAPQDVPVLEGQLLNFNGSPNRFGLPPFYELHVWAWRDNPRGNFVDWNTKVSCQ